MCNPECKFQPTDNPDTHRNGRFKSHHPEGSRFEQIEKFLRSQRSKGLEFDALYHLMCKIAKRASRKDIDEAISSWKEGK